MKRRRANFNAQTSSQATKIVMAHANSQISIIAKLIQYIKEFKIFQNQKKVVIRLSQPPPK